MSEAVTSTGADATPAVETIEVHGGDGPVTFDDLERVESQSKAAKKAEKDQVKETVKETVKALDKSKKESKDESDDDSEEDNESKDSSKKADDKEKADKKEAGKKEDKSKVEKSGEKKALKAKLGDKELELDPDTVVRIPIDGKEEEVSIRDMQRHFTGKTSWEKKFSELAKERQNFTSKVNQASSKIKQIFEEQDPEMRLFRMAEFAGKDPVEVRRNFLQENIKLLEKYYAMDEHERNADEQAFETKVLKHRLEFKEKQEASRNAQAALQAKISQLGTTQKISEEDFWNQYDQIKAAKESGTFKGKITPEFVAETIQKERLWNSAADILENSQSELPSHKRQAALLDLVESAHMQGLGPKEVREIAEEMWGKSRKNAVIQEKVAEQEELRTGKRSGKKAEYSGSNEALLFDDL